MSELITAEEITEHLRTPIEFNDSRTFTFGEVMSLLRLQKIKTTNTVRREVVEELHTKIDKLLKTQEV